VRVPGPSSVDDAHELLERLGDEAFLQQLQLDELIVVGNVVG
jgi:hypothetical protein